MRSLLIACACLSFATPIGGAAETDQELCQPWPAEYGEAAATGAHVLALWSFNELDPQGKVPDVSGHVPPATLAGASLAPDGRFGACLESACGWPQEDKPHRAMVPNHPRLSPAGAFTLECWLRPKPELAGDYPDAFLLDKKYVAHDDYQLILGPPGSDGARVLRACLGFGEDSSTWHARPVKLEPGVWRHIAFTYDGQGTGSFFVDGMPWGQQRIAGRRAISPGRHGLSIGDRIGSYHHGFPGFLDQVRLSSGALEFRRAKVQVLSDRTCFVRRETAPVIRLAVTNLLRAPVPGARLTVGLEGLPPQPFELAEIASGASATVDYRLDTSLRPDEYTLLAELDVTQPEPYRSTETFSLRLVPRPVPDRFPVLMWGIYGGVSEELERLQRIGFTHVLGLGADYDKIWKAGAPTDAGDPDTVARTRQALDVALANDLTVVASLSPGSWLRSQEPFRRVDRKGQPYKQEEICGLCPEIRPFCQNVGASVARTYGDHPAFGGALIHTEVRDHAQPCFHPHDRDAFRAAAGFDIPPEAGGRGGVDYKRLADFPASRVIPDNHPLYVYYQWYWKHGDGWNALNSAVAEGLRSKCPPGFWTFHDPAVRVASVYGSGGSVDVLSQWTYSYPDPIRIGIATDELLAMTGGSGGRQQVMKMTQIIWYRGQTAPIKKPGEPAPPPADWERRQPDAPFITIAPLHLREAFWTKIARPIKGIMYHGWQSLVPCVPTSGYRFTHPETQAELARLIRDVVRPLGPTLLQVPPVPSDVACLQSFASQMFAHRGTYGWGGGWSGDAYEVLLWAHLQPEIVYDETIATRGLDGFRVLVMPDCDVLTQTVAERIQQFQARGGLVVGDENTAPAIKPDLVLTGYKRTGRADQDKAALQALAADLRKQLDSRYTRAADCTNPDLIPYRRAAGDADYVFVVNDRREYGSYVGQHGLVMENGQPSAGTLTLARSGGYVYDLVDHVPVPARADGGQLRVDLELGPCDGRLYLASYQALGGVRVEVPDSVPQGGQAKCRVQVVDTDGKPFQAIVPLAIEIRDAAGRPAEGSGAYAAADGLLELTLDIAPNDVPGIWQITARELASNRVTRAHCRVPAPAAASPAAPPAGAANPVQPKG